MAFNQRGQWVSTTAKVDQRGRSVLTGPTLDAFGVEVFGLSTTHDLGAISTDGDSTLTATLSIAHPLEATLTGDSTLSDVLQYQAALIIEVDGDSSVDPDLSGGSILLDATLVGDSTLSDVLGGDLQLTAQLDGDSTIEAAVTPERLLAAQLDGDSTLDSSILVDRGLEVTVSGDSELISDIGLVITLGNVQMDGDSTLEGDAVVFQPVGLIYVPLPPQYAVVIAEIDGTEIDEIPATDLNVAFVLNDTGKCGFSLPLVHPKSTQAIIDEGKKNIHVYRRGELFWGGRLWSTSVDTDIEDETFQVAGADWFSLLFKRHLAETIDPSKLNFQDEDQLDVAWKIIKWTQDVETLGIIRDNPAEASGKLINVKYPHWERVKVAVAIQELTDSDDGFDFELTPDKRWKTHYPRRGGDASVVFEYGKNVEKIGYTKDAEKVISELSGLGSGSDRNRCISVETDAEALADFGLLQDSVDFSEVKNYSRLEDKTKAELRKWRRPLWQPTLVAVTEDPAWGEYELGDYADVKADYGFLQIDRKFRIIALNVRWDEENTKETIEVYFDETTVNA